MIDKQTGRQIVLFLFFLKREQGKPVGAHTYNPSAGRKTEVWDNGPKREQETQLCHMMWGRGGSRQGFVALGNELRDMCTLPWDFFFLETSSYYVTPG